MSEYIRNREGKIIGKQSGDWMRDGTGKIVAKYDESMDVTRDGNGRIVGKGDQRKRQLED